MSERLQWQKATAIRRIKAEQDVASPPPLRISLSAAATYVDATVAQVEAWWTGRVR